MRAWMVWLCLMLSNLALPTVASEPDKPWAFAEQEVDCISVAHLGDGVRLVFFWARVQGEWTCLDHRWLSGEMTPQRIGGQWVMEWRDDQDDCYRRVRTKCWIESWERDSQLAEQQRRPWFARLLSPGLKKPQ